MRAAIQKVEKRDFTWIIVLVLIAVPLIVEFLAGEDLYNKSYDSIIDAQDFMVDKFKLKLFENIEIIHNNSYSPEEKNSSEGSLTSMNDYIYSFLNENDTQKDSKKTGPQKESKKTATKDIFASEFLHLINSNNFYLILCAILFNFVNIYKVFILAMTVFAANFISSTLSYIFQSPKPYMAYYKIKSGAVFNEWSSPNNQIVVLVSFCFSLYKVLVSNKVMEKKLFTKILLILLFVCYAFIDIFLLFASGNCTYNHIIISLFFAVVIFLVIFYIFKVNLNKAKQFYDFIRFNFIYYLVINALLFVFNILLSYFIIDDRDINYYGDNGKEQIKLMPSNKFSDKFCKYRKLFFLNDGNLCNIICFLMNIIAFIGLRLDLHFTYQDNYNSWSEGNFEKPKVEGINNDQSSAGEYSHLEESQWNHYGGCRTAIRFGFLMIFIIVLFSVFILISSWSSNETYNYIFLIVLPMALHVFGIFYYYKHLFSRLKLVRPPKIKGKKSAFK